MSTELGAFQYGQEKHYDFSVRQKILDSARDLDLVANNYHNRAYANPHLVIESLKDSKHRLTANIQLFGGARLEGVGLIKKEQLKGYHIDIITNKKVGIIETKEKGGKIGDIMVSLESYEELSSYIEQNKVFKIKRSKYLQDIKESCEKAGEISDGSHAFRWNFAQRRMFECGQAEYTYEQSLQFVSWEMKHNRASISEHYLC